MMRYCILERILCSFFSETIEILENIGVSEKTPLSTSGQRQLLTRSNAAAFRLLVDFDIDEQMLGNARENMDVVQRSMTIHCGLKWHDYKQIYTKAFTTLGRDTCTEASVKLSALEYDGGPQDLTGFSKKVGPPSDIAEAVSKVLSE
jgi:hypothetical protein